MALQRCVLGKNIFWPALQHFDGLKNAHRMFSWHSEIRMLNIELSKKGYLRNVSRLCSNNRMPRFKEMPRNYHWRTSKIENDDDDDDDDDDNGHRKTNTGLDTLFEDATELSSPEWEDVISRVSLEERKMNSTSCDALMTRRCHFHGNYPLATSYLGHIERQGREPNLATLSIYLEICAMAVAHCGEERVLEVYRQLCSRVKMLDSKLSKSAILGLTSTREWKQAFKHIPIIKKMSNVCRRTYSAIIAAAFRNGEYDTGWRYLEEMCHEEKVPLDEVFLEWLQQCSGAEETEDKKAMAFNLFNKLGLYEIFPNVPVIQEIERLFVADDIGWSGQYVRIPPSGRCPACRHQLEGLDIEEKEFKNLQEEFVPRVLRGSDIFLATSPEEWEEFRSFVEENKPFTVVVDGLNVAYATGSVSPTNRGHMIKDVIQKALKKYPGGRVLVIGRKHLTQYLPQSFRNNNSVSVYTVNNLSKDDGFFIYAALQSGLGTKIISSDMLRDHLHRLGQTELRETFRRWQRTHQLMAVSSKTRVHLVDPARFSTTAQDDGQGWHIPYDDGSPRFSYELPATWLCLQPGGRSRRSSSSSSSPLGDAGRFVPRGANAEASRFVPRGANGEASRFVPRGANGEAGRFVPRGANAEASRFVPRGAYDEASRFVARGANAEAVRFVPRGASDRPRRPAETSRDARRPAKNVKPSFTDIFNDKE